MTARIAHIARLASLACMALGAAACSLPKPHAWTDAERGFQVESDYPQGVAEPTVTKHLHESLRFLDTLFGETDLSRLRVVIHDQPVGGPHGNLAGQIAGDRIDLFAAMGGPGASLAIPAFNSESVVHEFVHAYVRAHAVSVSRGLEEGLANVIGGGVIDENGQWHLFRDVVADGSARQALADGEAYPAQEFFSFVDSYPPTERLPLFYAQATSLARFLVEQQSDEAPQQIRAVLQLSAEELAAGDAAWRDRLSREPPHSWYVRNCRHPSAAFRERIAGAMRHLDDNAAWRVLGLTLLGDDDRHVRATARISCVYWPGEGDLDAFADHARWFATRPQPNVSFAGTVGLAQTGDLDAALQVLDAVAAGEHFEAGNQTVFWIALRIRGRPDSFELTPMPWDDTPTLPEWCTDFAAWIRAHRDTIAWDADRQSYTVHNDG